MDAAAVSAAATAAAAAAVSAAATGLKHIPVKKNPQMASKLTK